uniref:Uncharacterized protein n=1 Tax=Leersia perrieri TaxID=77586 RepID=A0A0D9VI03_9ORYZ
MQRHTSFGVVRAPGPRGVPWYSAGLGDKWANPVESPPLARSPRDSRAPRVSVLFVAGASTLSPSPLQLPSCCLVAVAGRRSLRIA